MRKIFGGTTALLVAIGAVASILGTASVAQTRSECQYYSVTTCAGDRWQGPGYTSYGACQQDRFRECMNGGPIDAALKLKPEPLLAAAKPSCT